MKNTHRPAHFVVVLAATLSIWPVTTPVLAQECPEPISHLPVSAFAVAASDGYAYVASSGGLQVLDVGDPAAPFEVGNIAPGGYYSELAVSEDHVYMTDVENLRVIDVSTPSEPVEVGDIHPSYFVWGLAVSRGYAYLACDTVEAIPGFEGLVVVDVSTPSAPVEVGELRLLGRPVDIVVSGGYAFVVVDVQVDRFDGLRVIDVSTPSSPVEVGFFEGNFSAVAVSGSYAYITGVDGLHVVDVSNPSTPVEVGTVVYDAALDDWEQDVAVSYGYAYVVGSRFDDVDDRDVQGLRVIDISTPTAPVEVGVFETPARRYEPKGVAVSDGAVFFAANYGGLYVFSECARSPNPDARACYIPAAAVASGAEGAFFQTDVEINNKGSEEAQVSLQWLPRGEDNLEPMESERFTLASDASLRFDNVLTEVFGLEPDSLGAIKVMASTEDVIGMSRTYNSPPGGAAGTFGQGLPAIRETDMIMGTASQRILFLSEDDDFRANVGCVNATDEELAVSIRIFDNEGSLLETRTIELGPHSNNQLNHVLGDWAPANGYADVWADRDDALYTCYGSMLDNQTSDPSTVLPQVPSDETTYVPAAALAAGLEGSFFTTDLDLNNAGSSDLTYELLWLPRGENNSDPVRSDTFSLSAGSGVRYSNVLGEVFDLEPDEVGALAIEASGNDLLAMSRTYNLPMTKAAGTFGQGMSGIPADRMIPTGVTKRILFLSENDDVRSNVGCVNGVGTEATVAITLYDSDGIMLDIKYTVLSPYSNRQINGIFRDHAPIDGYVDFRTHTSDALIYCYGSVLDNLTNDPTTVLPQ